MAKGISPLILEVMTKIQKADTHKIRCVQKVFFILSIILVIFFIWHDIFYYHFTAEDTLTLIETNRIQSYQDLVKILTDPLMSGTRFAARLKYYRPIASLTFSLDYFLWKLKPFGYHLTDLVLHTLVGILVFFFILLLVPGRPFIAWLAAMLFILHPMHTEIVPAVARRQDILAAMLILFSLILFIKGQSSMRLRWFFISSSLLFYVLALGAKEIAIIVPLLIFSLSFLRGNGGGSALSQRAIRAFRKSLPFCAASVIWMAWRFYVLHGLGGVSYRALGIKFIALSSLRICKNYIFDLIFPVNYLTSLLAEISTKYTYRNPGYWFFSGVIFCGIFLWGRKLWRRMTGLKGSLNLLKKYLSAAFFMTATGFLIFPWFVPTINWILRRFTPKPGTIVIGYVEKVRNLVFSSPGQLRIQYLSLSLFFWLLCLILIALAWLHIWGKIRCRVSKTALIFSLVWLILPLAVYLGSVGFAHRNIYISLIPLSLGLSTTLVEGSRQYISLVRPFEFPGLARRFFHSKATFASLMGLFLIVVFIMVTSPLFRKYNDWELSGKISSNFLEELSGKIPQLPHDAELYITGLPGKFFEDKDKMTHPRELTFLSDYSIKSWLDLKLPGNQIKVFIVQSVSIKRTYSVSDLEVSHGQGRIVNIHVKTEAASSE